MAQTNYTPIQIYSSSTGGATPSAGNLVNNSLGSELAINITDGKLFYKDNAGVVQVIGTKGGVGSSSNTQVLFNSSGLVTGSANLAFNGTATLTLGSWAITPAGAGTAVTLSFPVSTTYTFPNLASATLATTGTLTQTFSGTTTFSGTFTQSGATGTFGSSTAAGTYALGSGATTNGTTRTINIGTAGVAGSIVNVNVGSSASTSGTTTLQSAVTTVSNEFRVSQLTSGRVPYVSTSGRLVDNAGFGASITATTSQLLFSAASTTYTQLVVENTDPGAGTGYSLILSRAPAGSGDSYLASASNGGNAIVQAETQPSAADAFMRAIITGTTTWTWGIDNSDSDSWVLAASDTLGTSNALAITTAGNATLTGDFTVSGGDILTGAATATVFNTTATTVNIGGAATTMAIGASGTSTVTFGHQIVATTSARSPLMIGGTGTTSTLTLRATSGTAANGAAVIVQADSGVEAFRTDYLGNVLLGATTRQAATPTNFPKLQVHGVAGSDSAFSQTRWSADATGPIMFLGKSRGATVGTRGAVSSGDALGTIFWTGDDGTNSEIAARILVTASGTVSTGIVPGQMAFYTTDATGANIVSAYINNAQQFVVASSNSFGVGPLSTASTLAVTGTSAKQVEVSTTLNNANDSELHFMKARGGTSLATIVSGDDLGTIVWKGYDGATHDTSATILVSSSGTISSGVVQSSMVFRNADTAGTLRNTLVIDRNGMTSVGTATRTRDALSTTAPALFYTGTSTITDGTTAASGTVTHGAIVAFDNPAIAATNASVTYTNASTVYIDGAPTASTNVTITNAFSLFVNSGEARFGGAIRSSGATNGIGYATGAGGTVTQITSKATGVTLNKACGQITMDASALNADTTVSFVLTNSAIAAGDQLILNHISGGTPGSYLLNARSAAGSATLDVRNVSAGSLSEAIVISFSVIKAVTA